MIDSIGSATNSALTQRAQTVQQSNSVRNPSVITAVQQTQQKSSGATAPVKVFAVPQSGKTGGAQPTKVPRGSLVDQLV